MKKNQPSKLKEALSIFLVGYIFGLAGAGPLALKLYYDDTHWIGESPKLNTPDWFYSAFAFGIPFVLGTLIFGVFLRDTRHRASDPYRFSRRQYRFIKIRESSLIDISAELIKLGYSIFFDSKSDDEILVEAGRVFVPKDSRFFNTTHPTPHKLCVRAKRAHSYWAISVECYPASSVAIADFKNTIYDSLEELVDKFSWRSGLVSSLQE